MRKFYKGLVLGFAILISVGNAVELNDASDRQLLNELERRLQSALPAPSEGLIEVSSSCYWNNAYTLRLNVYDGQSETETKKQYPITLQNECFIAADAINKKASALKNGGLVAACRWNNRYEVLKLRITRSGAIQETIEQMDNDTSCRNQAAAINAIN